MHILLAAYPIMLFSGGDIRPSVRYMGKCFLLLLAMAVPIYCVNLLLDTNFMFLMYAPDGNPLAWFRDHVGYHWIGFPVLLVAVFALMDVPIMLKKRKEDKLLSAVKYKSGWIKVISSPMVAPSRGREWGFLQIGVLYAVKRSGSRI